MKKSLKKLIYLTLLLSIIIPNTVLASSLPEKNSELAFDVVFVIDGSGSMRKSDPNKIAVEAAKLFTDMCEYSSSRVGYVLYTQNIEEEKGLTKITDDTARIDFKKMLNGISYKKSGYTDIALGLTRAMKMLTDANSIGSGRNPLIILLSDGKTELPNGSRTVEASMTELSNTTEQLKGYGVPVYTIGLNVDGTVDTGALAKIAEDTEAKSYITEKAADLPSILSDIFANHIKVKKLELVSFTGDNTSRQVTIPIPDDSVYEANIIILSSKPVKDLHLYTPPPGRVEVAIPSDSVIYNTSKCYTLIKIISPEPGDWLLELTGANGDQITINLLRSYDFGLIINVDPKEVYRTGKAEVSVGISNEDGTSDDESVFIDAKGVLHIENIETGEITDLALTYSGSTMTASVPCDTVGSYRLSAAVTGSNDSFYKESNVEEIKVISNVLAANITSIDKSVIQGLGDVNYSFTDLVSWDKSEGISIISDYDADPAVCSIDVDYDKSVVKIIPENAGEASFNLIFKDGYGQEVQIPVKLQILPIWPFILGLLLILIIAAAIITAIKLKNRPDLKGKLIVSVCGTNDTPPEIELDMVALHKTKGNIPLMDIVRTEPQYGRLVGQALAAIGQFALGITVSALDKECSRISVSVPAASVGSVLLNGNEISGKRTAEMSKQGVLNIRYIMGQQIYDINITFERNAFDDNISISSDSGIDPFGGAPGNAGNIMEGDDPFPPISTDNPFGNDFN